MKHGAVSAGVVDGDRGVPGGEEECLPASASQIDYVRRLAGRIGRAAGLRVEVLAQRCFGRPLAELSRHKAACLILALPAVKAGELNWETALEESTVRPPLRPRCSRP